MSENKLRKIKRDILYTFVSESLMSAYFWFIRLLRRRSIKLTVKVIQALNLCIRIQLDGAQQSGADRELDRNIYIATIKLLKPHYFEDSLPEIFLQDISDSEKKHIEEITNGYRDHKTEIDRIIATVEASSQIRILREIYSLAHSYFHALLKLPDEQKLSQAYFEIAQSINPKAQKFVHADIDKKMTQVKKITNQCNSTLKDADTIKIDISLADAGQYLAFITAGLIVSAFLYNQHYYAHFGFQVSSYFSISDYLSSSVEGLFEAGITVFFSLFIVFLGMQDRSRKSHAQLEYEKEQRDYFPLHISLIVGIMLFYGYQSGGRTYNNTFSLSIVFLSYLIIPNLSKRFFKNSFSALIIMTLVVCWGSRVYWKASDDILNVEEFIEDKNEKKCDELTLSTNISSQVDTCSLVFIGSNSNYSFFVTKDRQTSIALKREDVTIRRIQMPEKKRNILETVVQTVEKLITLSVSY